MLKSQAETILKAFPSATYRINEIIHREDGLKFVFTKHGRARRVVALNAYKGDTLVLSSQVECTQKRLKEEVKLVLAESAGF